MDIDEGKAQTKMMGDYLRECMRERQKQILLLLRIFIIISALALAAGRYLSVPAEVSMEKSSSFEGTYTGYKVWCDEGQPFFGLTENGEVQEVFPIEKSEYDEVMKINFRPYMDEGSVPFSGKAGDIMADNIYGGIYYRVTLKCRSGKEESSGFRIDPLLGKMVSLEEKYSNTD